MGVVGSLPTDNETHNSLINSHQRISLLNTTNNDSKHSVLSEIVSTSDETMKSKGKICEKCSRANHDVSCDTRIDENDSQSMLNTADRASEDESQRLRMRAASRRFRRRQAETERQLIHQVSNLKYQEKNLMQHVNNLETYKRRLERRYHRRFFVTKKMTGRLSAHGLSVEDDEY